MVSLVVLWMPILLSAVIVFVASSIIWMATPLHKHDYKNPGDKEDSIISMLKSAAFEPGVYSVPWCHGKEKDPADPVPIQDVHATVLTALGIEPGKLLQTPIGRTVKLSEGKVIPAILG